MVFKSNPSCGSNSITNFTNHRHLRSQSNLQRRLEVRPSIEETYARGRGRSEITKNHRPEHLSRPTGKY